jgi:hypothetical protein
MRDTSNSIRCRERIREKGTGKVKAFLDGVLYRGPFAKIGHDRHIIRLTKEVRKKIGKNPGDMVHVIIEEDLEERTVEIPRNFWKDC